MVTFEGYRVWRFLAYNVRRWSSIKLEGVCRSSVGLLSRVPQGGVRFLGKASILIYRVMRISTGGNLLRISLAFFARVQSLFACEGFLGVQNYFEGRQLRPGHVF